MKKNLFLVFVVVFFAGFPLISRAELFLSGSQTYALKFYSGDKDVSATTTDSEDEHDLPRLISQVPSFSELVIRSESISDGGLIFGAEIQLRPSVEVEVDEAFVYVGGDSWGRIILGADDGALYRTVPRGGSVLVGLEGLWGGTSDSVVGGDEDTPKLVYMSPKWGSWSGALSMTPVKKTELLFTDDEKEGSGEGAVSLGLLYEGEWDRLSYDFGVGAIYENVFNRNRELESDSTQVAITKSVGDMWGYQAGGKFAYKTYGFSFGYGEKRTTRKAKVFKDDAVEADYVDSFLSFGVRYDYRKGGMSIGYNIQNRTSNADSGLNYSGSATLLDLDYKLGEGLVVILSGSLNASDSDALDASNDDKNRSETVFGLGLRALF